MQEIIRLDLEGVNAYLLKKDGQFLLVDTGGHMFMDSEYNDRKDLLVKKMEEHGVNSENLAWIILTHGDNDHVCNAKQISKAFDASIAMNEKDIFMVSGHDSDVYKINSKYESFVLKIVFKIMGKKIDRLMEKVYEDFESFEVQHLLTDGESLESFGFDGVVYETPGHTSGSICILDSNGNLISGDLFANNKKPSLAINAENFAQMKQSAARMNELKIRKVYPGHGAPYEIMH